jgi:4-hydroxy 2-oxovalerate aldolase
MNHEILDCTFRDGGYYTEWDFDDVLIDTYLKSFENLPIDYLEIGYKSPPKPEYLGKFFYCPNSVIEYVKSKSTKKLAVLLNEKDIEIAMLPALLGDCIGKIDLIRVAVNPINIERAIKLSTELKSMGFSVAFNVMYMSTWHEIDGFMDSLEKVDGVIDYFYLVDSFGSVYPDEVKILVNEVRRRLSCKIGFHGHNNLELGLINTLAAIEAGVDIVDATVTGMGRGAGNLKTELLLTSLSSKYDIKVDFNALGSVVSSFEALQMQYRWGTNLPYMVSGANSLPQKKVMEWVGKRFYSMNSIVQALNNQSAGLEDNIKLDPFMASKKFDSVLIIGGGPSINKHAKALHEWISNQENLCVVHASSKNASKFTNLHVEQIFCLVGNEGYRLEEQSESGFEFVSKCVLPPYPRTMGTYIPSVLKEKSFELEKVTFTDKVKDSHTVLSLQTALELGAQKVYLAGYDGFEGENIKEVDLEVAKENELLFDEFNKKENLLTSLTPTKYEQLIVASVYAEI